MKRSLLSLLLLPLSMLALAQQVTLNKQHHFPKTVPAGNYSGITWLGGNRYAVADDKSPTAGFHLMTIRIDDKTGDIREVRVDSFMTSRLPNRDEEGICYVAGSNTLFVSGESDGQIVEYALDGQLTGRKLNIPTVFGNTYKNGSFEALTYNAKTHRFWTTTENTLKADGDKPSLKRNIFNLLRLQSFGDDLQPKEQYWYMSDSSDVKRVDGKGTLGVSGLAALDDGQIIVLEREVYRAEKNIGSYVKVKLYVVNPSMQKPGDLLQKQLVTQFSTKINVTDRSFANYEGICVGPQLKDGRTVLMLVCDSQNQYKGYLRDWFRTVTVSKLDFRPQPNTTADIPAFLKAFSTIDNDTKQEMPSFLSKEEMPNPLLFISAPPQPGNGAFANDTYYYQWGKEQRQTPRGNQAALDEVKWTSSSFSETVGFIIGPTETPEIYKLVQGAQKDATAVNKSAKNHFRRTRPYVYFDEPSLVSKDDGKNRDTYSYPSGHSIRGWVCALTLALIVPDSTETLIRRAQEYALNRVVCGRHWKSDTEAALLEAVAVMSRLNSNAAFLEQLDKARKEYASLMEKRK